MAIIYFSYLFDSLEFYKTMSPIIPRLEMDEYQPLYELAKYTMETKPELWPLLDNLYLGPPFAEKDEEPSPGRILTMVLAQFLQPIAEFGPGGGWTFLKVALPLIGWSEEDVELLLFGKSLCTLLVPYKTYDPSEDTSRLQNMPWCAGYVNWLDIATIDELDQRLTRSQEAYFTLCRQPQFVQERICTRDNVNLPMEWYSEGLTKDYADIRRILTTARNAQKSLAMAIA
jgi:hypothetical protein